MVKLSWLVPTRGRPHLLNRFLDSVFATAADPTQVEVILRIDDDDPSMSSYTPSQTSVRLLKGPRASMGTLNTEALRAATGDVIILGNDDLVLRSLHWDRSILQASALYDDGICLIHVKDGFVNHRHICFPILSKRFCSLIQDPFPAAYQGDHIDTHLEDLFRRLSDLGHHRFIYLDNVFFEHLTPAIGKGVMDEIYSKRNHFRDYLPFLLLWKTRANLARELLHTIKSGLLPSPPAPLTSMGHLRALQALFQSIYLDRLQTRSYRLSFLKEHLYRYAKLAIKTAFPFLIHLKRLTKKEWCSVFSGQAES